MQKMSFNLDRYLNSLLLLCKSKIDMIEAFSTGIVNLFIFNLLRYFFHYCRDEISYM